MIKIIMENIPSVITGVAFLVGTYFVFKLTIKDHEKRIHELEKDTKNIPGTLGTKIDKLTDKISDLGEKVAFMYGSLQAFEDVKHSIEKLVNTVNCKD